MATLRDRVHVGTGDTAPYGTDGGINDGRYIVATDRDTESGSDRRYFAATTTTTTTTGNEKKCNTEKNDQT